eukprot:642732-Rhodomonas_salina.1
MEALLQGYQEKVFLEDQEVALLAEAMQVYTPLLYSLSMAWINDFHDIQRRWPGEENRHSQRQCPGCGEKSLLNMTVYHSVLLAVTLDVAGSSALQCFLPFPAVQCAVLVGRRRVGARELASAAGAFGALRCFRS